MRPNGKFGIEVLTSQLPDISIARGCVIDHIVFLDRKQRAGAHLERYGTECALRWFEQFARYGSGAVLASQRAVYRRLLTAGIWKLSYQDLDPAIAELQRLVDGAG